MEYHVKVNLLGTAAVLVLGIGASVLASTAVVSRTIDARTRQAAKGRQEITVKGSARTRVRADAGVWDISVKGEAKELAEAFTVLESATVRVADFLKQRGFTETQIHLSAIETTTHFVRDDKGKETRDTAGYTLERIFTVTTPDVDKIAGAAGEVTGLIKDGVKVASARPRFVFTKAADMKIQILGDASKDARARADEIARNAGGKVGIVKDAQMGVLQITQPNSTDVSSYGLYDTTTIDKDVSAVVTVTFGIE